MCASSGKHSFNNPFFIHVMSISLPPLAGPGRSQRPPLANTSLIHANLINVIHADPSNAHQFNFPRLLTPSVQVPTLAALAYHKSTGRTPASPNQRLGYTENFLYMLDGGNSANAYRPHPKLVRALVSLVSRMRSPRLYWDAVARSFDLGWCFPALVFKSS